MAGPTVSRQKMVAASRGDSAALLEVLGQLATTTTQQQAVTGTTPKNNVVAGQPNSSAPVPPQATGSVSILGGAYVVQIVNPGGQSPISAVQSAEAAGNPNLNSPVQPQKAIYHQIRASTSPAFNVNSNTQTFGGNTGQIQTYWTLTGLGSGTWFIQFRSSYDGINFNRWRNANSGNALGGLVNEVTEENAGNSEWALFTLPGNLITGVGAGIVADQEQFGLAEQVYSSGMIAIAGPNGFPPQGNGVSGFTLSDVDIVEPATGLAGVVGVPDFPVEIRCQMAIADGFSLSPSFANVFAIAFDPTNENVTLYEEPGGTTVWAVLRLPGGARIALGQGKNLDQTQIWVPPALTWIDPSRMMSICSLTDTPQDQAPVTGFGQNQLSGLVAAGNYLHDSGHLGAAGIQSVNWMAIAWQQGTDVQTINGFPWLKIQLQGGHAMFLGAGQSASGTPVVLPTGCSFDNSLSICTPGGSDNSGNHMRGIQQCAMLFSAPWLVYTDNSSTWGGNVNWLIAAWI